MFGARVLAVVLALLPLACARPAPPPGTAAVATAAADPPAAPLWPDAAEAPPAPGPDDAASSPTEPAKETFAAGALPAFRAFLPFYPYCNPVFPERERV